MFLSGVIKISLQKGGFQVKGLWALYLKYMGSLAIGTCLPTLEDTQGQQHGLLGFATQRSQNVPPPQHTHTL